MQVDQNERNIRPQQQSNFQLMHRKRISQLQQKVNQYCSEYDALMNILPIANNFNPLNAFKKQVQLSDHKITKLNQKYVLEQSTPLKIDKSYWQNQFNQIKNVLKDNHQSICKLQQKVEQNFIKQQKVGQNSRSKLNYPQNRKSNQLSRQEQQAEDIYQKLLQYKIQQYQKFIYQQLAQHKNLLTRNKKIYKSDKCKNLKQQLQQTIEKQFQPIQSLLLQLQQTIQISKLKIPRTDLYKFHQFNYNRLSFQIMSINQDLQQAFQTLTKNDPSLIQNDTKLFKNDKDLAKTYKKLTSHTKNNYNMYGAKITQNQKQNLLRIQKEINQIKYQIKGSRQKYQNDFLVRYSENSTNTIKLQNLQLEVQRNMMELQKILKQVQFKYQELIKHINT